MTLIAVLLSAVLAHAAPKAARPDVHAGQRYDVRLNPLGLIIGTIDLNFDLAIDRRWTLGPVLRYASHEADYDDGGSTYAVHYLGIGARGNWFKRGVFRDGLYLAPTVTYVNAGLRLDDRYGRATEYSASGLMFGGLVGYGWFWDSFNVMLGGGLDLTLGPRRITVRNAAGRTENVRATLAGLALETSVGCTF